MVSDKYPVWDNRREQQKQTILKCNYRVAARVDGVSPSQFLAPENAARAGTATGTAHCARASLRKAKPAQTWISHIVSSGAEFGIVPAQGVQSMAVLLGRVFEAARRRVP